MAMLEVNGQAKVISENKTPEREAREQKEPTFQLKIQLDMKKVGKSPNRAQDTTRIDNSSK